MTITYNSKTGMEALMPVLDEHVIWYGRLIKSYFEGRPFNESHPMSFTEWLGKARIQNTILPNMANRLEHIHKDMLQAADAFTNKYGSKGNELPLAEYSDLSRHYEEFIQVMRRLEHDQALENSGFDDRTGLRSAKLLNADVARELERRSRRGSPFSVALIKINDFDEAWKKNEDLFYQSIRAISEKIKECLRSFDDAYYLGNEYFILSFKQADSFGSQSAVVRLNKMINAAQISVPEKKKETMSVSSVVCEPMLGDDFDQVIENMKQDLMGLEVKGTVLQFNDISPLQRYIHTIGKEK